MSYMGVISELHKLETWSDEQKELLEHISKFLRNKIWPIVGETWMFSTLSEVNLLVLKLPCTVEAIEFYLEKLSNYASIFGPKTKDLFEKEQEAINILAAKRLLELQWKDILSPAGDAASFSSVFNLFYEQCIASYPEQFFISAPEIAACYRAVSDPDADAKRFTPLPNKTQNRWNPPGKTYLYLSYEETDTVEVNSCYTHSQHTCLLEKRASAGKPYAVCRFKLKDGLHILDLSYNDTTFDALRRIMENTFELACHELESEWTPTNPEKMKLFIESREGFTGLLSKAISESFHQVNLNEAICVSLGKQYLKLVCDTVIRPIDDSVDKEEQYRSFWQLATILEAKGVDGIVYPSTRMELIKLVAKNLVLFDVGDATPQMETKQLLKL